VKLPEFKLERFFAEHEFSAKYLMCSSDCESMSIAELLNLEPGSEEKFLNHQLCYTESPGSPTLRAEIANLYDHITADDVVVFAGAQEGILLFLQGMLNQEDHAIVNWPCYQSLFEVTDASCGQVDRWTLDSGNAWRLDLDKLESMIRPNTKAIVINTPHNPTGYLMSRGDWASLHLLAAERGIFVFCDEVYRESEYEEADRLAAGCDMGSHGISLGVMSKTYGLAGLRIGWIASQNRDVIDTLRGMKDYRSHATWVSLNQTLHCWINSSRCTLDNFSGLAPKPARLHFLNCKRANPSTRSAIACWLKPEYYWPRERCLISQATTSDWALADQTLPKALKRLSDRFDEQAIERKKGHKQEFGRQTGLFQATPT